MRLHDPLVTVRAPALHGRDETPAGRDLRDPESTQVRWQLSRDPAQVRVAREQTRKALFDWGLGDHADLAELVVSELVTNAICHGDGTARLGVSHAGEYLRVEVHDGGAGRPVRCQPDDAKEAGRGLALIDGLLELNGGKRGMNKDRRGPGKTIYVLIRLTAQTPGQGEAAEVQ